jgi:transposase
MVKKRNKYTREFKLEAVRLSEESEEPAAEIARQLGIRPNLLYRWREQFLKDGEEAFPGQGKLRPGDDEVRRLRRENARLREERDVLKKAIAFFAKESR